MQKKKLANRYTDRNYTQWDADKTKQTAGNKRVSEGSEKT